MSFTPAVSLTSQIADHIGRQIIAGDLQARERIQELRIAKELGVSRGSVREALLILESRALVEILPRRGAVVSGLGIDDISELADISVCVSQTLFRRLAEHIRRTRDVNLVEIERAVNVAKCASEQDSLEEFIDAKFALVRASLQLIGSTYLKRMIEDLMPSWYRIAVIAHRHPRAEIRDGGRYTCALWEAVRSYDIERVDELVGAFGRREARMAQEALN